MLGGTIALALAHDGGKVAWVVPTYRNGRPLWRWAEQAVAHLKRRRLVRVNRNERTIEFTRTGGFVGIYSMDNEDSIRGEAFHAVIVDEAAMVPETAWTDAIQPTLADYDGDAILISTPKGRNWFWREWQRGQEGRADIRSFTAPTSANPNPRIRRAAQLAQERTPERTYRQEWLAQFVEDGALSFSQAWWDGQNRYHADDEVLHNLTIGRYISWDTGLKDKVTNAYSAAVVFDLQPDYRVLVREVWRDRLTYPNLIPQIERLAAKHNRDGKLQAVIIEDKASGVSAIQTLWQAGPDWLRPLVVPFEPKGDKRMRGEQAAVWCMNDSVLLPHPAVETRWLLAFEDELYSAPDSAFMDMHDAFAQGILYLEHLLAAGLSARTGRGAA